MSKQITKREIVSQLKTLGLCKGDHIIVHSALSSLGKVKGGAATVIEALLQCVGPEGTIVMPSFGSTDKVFDPSRSRTNLGIIPQVFWQMKNALRSRDPLASVAAIGAKAKWLIDKHEKATTAHGKNTPYTRLAEIGGKILLLGVDQDRNTCLHIIEELARSPYLRQRKDKYIDCDAKERTKTSSHFPGPHRDFIGLQAWLEKSGLIKKTRIGNCIAQLLPLPNLLEALIARIEEEPGIFISKNPGLPAGIWQRAKIFEAEFNREAFTLAADSQFAGRYLEEIIENLNRFGIKNIVLSFINNIAWENIAPDNRAWYLKGLAKAGIKVSAIKMLQLNTDLALDILKKSKAETLILPSTCTPGNTAKIIKSGFSVYIENIAVSSERFISLMSGSGKDHPKISMAFNPLNFVQVGENPFLNTYARVKKYIGLLYINDGFATGSRTALEEGLAEIKELISILRCKSFSGVFVLQGTCPEKFCQSAEKFISILKELGRVP